MSNELARRDAGSATPARISLFEDKGKTVEAIVRYGAGGVVRALHTKIPLSESRKEVWMLGGMEDGKWVKRPQLTAVALDKANAVLGVKIFKPPTVCTDTTGPKPNPYVHRDANGAVEYVQVRGVGVWRNLIGNLCCRDLTITFDVRTYFAQDCWSKWMGKKSDAPKTWGKAYAHGQVPESELGPSKLIVAMPAGVDLVMDLRDKEVLGLVGEHTTRQKFADRIAQTICHRILIRKALGAVVPSADGALPVTGWIEPDADLEEIACAAEGMQQKIGDAYGEQVQVEVENMVPSHEDVGDMIDVAVDADEPSDVPEPSDEPGDPAATYPPDNSPSNLDILADDLHGHNPDKTIKECRERITRWCKILYKKVPDHLTDEQLVDARNVIGEGKVSM